MSAYLDRYINIGPYRTRYWDEGTGETLLLIHGFSGFIETWELNFPALSTHYRVVALDLLGHGQTDKPLEVSYRLPDLGRFVAAFMEALQIDHACVVGHSMGGGVALFLTLQCPKRVDKLILVDSSGLGRAVDLHTRLLSLPLVGESMLHFTREQMQRTLLAATKNRSAITPERVDLFYQMESAPGEAQALLKVVRDNGGFFTQQAQIYRPIVAHLSSIQQPVLVIWGEEDATLPVTHTDTARQHLPHAQIAIMPGCGHNPMVDEVEVFNQLVLDFLAAPAAPPEVKLPLTVGSGEHAQTA